MSDKVGSNPAEIEPESGRRIPRATEDVDTEGHRKFVRATEDDEPTTEDTEGHEKK